MEKLFTHQYKHFLVNIVFILDLDKSVSINGLTTPFHSKHTDKIVEHLFTLIKVLHKF